MICYKVRDLKPGEAMVRREMEFTPEFERHFLVEAIQGLINEGRDVTLVSMDIRVTFEEIVPAREGEPRP